MHNLPNDFAECYEPVFGIPKHKPVPGSTFDRNNDLTLSKCGEYVTHRDGHVTQSCGSVMSVMFDALIEYDRRHMSTRAFAECYGDDDAEEMTEMRMLHGDNA